MRKALILVSLYAVWRVQTDYVRADAVQRGQFRRRMARRVTRLMGVQRAGQLVRSVWGRVGQLTDRALSVQPAQFPRWTRAISGLAESGPLCDWPARRYETGPKIVVIAAGSIGDILQLTPVLRALRGKFQPSEICLLYSNAAAKTVLRGNLNLDAIAVATARERDEVRLAVREEGAADLVITVENVSFILSYTVAPRDRLHPALRTAASEEFLATALAMQAKWREFGPIYPRRKARFVWPGEWDDLHYLDVQGASGNLPIDRNSALDFVIDAHDVTAIEPFRPKQPYVTVQCGVDGFVMTVARATRRRPTKLLPPETLDAAVRMLRARGLVVIQLGSKDDDLVSAADADLRGRTSLREAAALMQGAVCHVGTEGGLVHLAYAVGVPSVVAFGPTSARFLGYPGNVNLEATGCDRCWWTTTDWFVTCPRGPGKPPCMNAHTADSIAEAVLDLLRTRSVRHDRTA